MERVNRIDFSRIFLYISSCRLRSLSFSVCTVSKMSGIFADHGLLVVSSLKQR